MARKDQTTAYTDTRQQIFARALKRSALCGVAAAALTGATALAADEPVAFDIEGGPLAAVLNEFGRQSDQDVLFSTDVIADKRAEALNGTYEPGEALAILLEDTGLAFSETAKGAILVSIEGASPAGGVVQTLDAPSRATGVMDTTAAPVNVTGGVQDERTGANLKGALVEIEETGQRTSTDDLGNFRFPVVRPGRYTLRISYLGYRDIEATIDVTPGRRFDQNFAMTGGDADDVIIVYGNRSARAQSLNQERTAANSTTVLSADILGNFNGTTISEALRRAPGVAFIPNEDTGDGANVVIRGLEPDLNQIQLNGIRLSEGSGLGRSADLSAILTESIESVTINKTLLPSQDSNGAGGLVEIETKSPLDRGDRFASFTVEYGDNGNDFGNEYQLGGTISRTFGDARDIGASFSVDYRKRDVTNLNYSVFPSGLGPFLPLGDNGDPISEARAIDPRRLFPFEDEASEIYPASSTAQRSSTEDKILSLTGSLEKNIGVHTNLRLDAFYTRQETDSFDVSTQSRTFGLYDLAPVTELGGEERYVFVVENPFGSTGFGDLFGPGILGEVERRASFSPEQRSQTLNITLRGETTIDLWEIDYVLGYNNAKRNSGQRYTVLLSDLTVGPSGFFQAIVDRAQLLPEALENTTGDGRVISIFAPLKAGGDDEFVLPLFNQEGFDFYNSIELQSLQRIISSNPRKSESKAPSARLSVRRNFTSGIVRYVNAGLDYRVLESFSPGSVNGGQSFTAGAGVSLDEIGLVFGSGLLTAVGADDDFSSLTRDGVEGVTTNLTSLASDGLLIAGPINEARIVDVADTSEKTLAGFFEAQLVVGKFEIIGGARIERTAIASTFFSDPLLINADGTAETFAELSDLVTAEARQTDILPRILLNYRPSENLVFRGGYYTTVSRPQLVNLTQQSRVRLDLRPNSVGLPSLLVNQGNPDLKPAVTHNFNLDAEWYFDDIGVVKFSSFYKTVDNPLQSNFSSGGSVDDLPDDVALPDIPEFQNLPSELSVTLTRPINGDENDEIWGMEVSVERQFSFLPGALGGFGIYSNYTYTDSKSTERISVINTVDPEGFVEISAPFFDAPTHQGTLGLTYNQYNIDANLFYTVQERRLSGVDRFGLDTYQEAIDTLDFRAEYLFEHKGAKVRFFFRGEDLLRGSSEPFLQSSIGGENGVEKYSTGSTYLGGRSFFVGASAVF